MLPQRAVGVNESITWGGEEGIFSIAEPIKAFHHFSLHTSNAPKIARSFENEQRKRIFHSLGPPSDEFQELTAVFSCLKDIASFYYMKGT